MASRYVMKGFPPEMFEWGGDPKGVGVCGGLPRDFNLNDSFANNGGMVLIGGGGGLSGRNPDGFICMVIHESSIFYIFHTLYNDIYNGFGESCIYI